MNIGKDLKAIHDQIYTAHEPPNNVFAGANAGIALAGHYIAEALKSNARLAVDNEISSLRARIEVLTRELTTTQVETTALTVRNADLHSQLQTAPASSRAPQTLHQLLFHLDRLLEALSGTPVTSDLHAALQNVREARKVVEL